MCISALKANSLNKQIGENIVLPQKMEYLQQQHDKSLKLSKLSKTSKFLVIIEKCLQTQLPPRFVVSRTSLNGTILVRILDI